MGIPYQPITLPSHILAQYFAVSFFLVQPSSDRYALRAKSLATKSVFDLVQIEFKHE